MNQESFESLLPLASDKELSKIEDAWGKLLSKELMALAKAETPNWYNIRFNQKFTPLRVSYNKKKIRVWGSPPNANVDGSQGSAPSRSAVIGKPKPICIKESRVMGSTRVYGEKTMWIRPKTYQPHEGAIFKSRTSHTEIIIERNAKGKQFYRKQGSRKYPFAALWRMGDSGVEFVPANESLADKLMSCSEFEDLLWSTFYKAIDSI